MATGTCDEAVLTYLATPPEYCGQTPVATRPQRLLLSSLTPRDFERLCHRLARVQGSVEDARIFGVPGQTQDGIDLYVRRRDGTYAVIQCKRSSGAFTPGKITEAVNKFRAGEWAAKAKEFVLAVTADLEPTGTARRIQKEQERLARQGVVFTAWDEAELSAMLKDHPRLVDDFFGRESVRLFAGEETALSLGGRLDAGDVIEYRRVMGELYREVFGHLERGVYSDAAHVPLDSRFVMPDVVVAEGVWPSFAAPVAVAVPAANVQPPVPSWSSPFAPDVASALERGPGGAVQIPVAAGNRVSAADWLNAGSWHLVMGLPGAGKSALLRTLVLDVLADSPLELGQLERTHGVLPLWLPFAYWTGAGKQHTAAPSVLQAVRSWLEAYDHGDLWPLVEKALSDERLLLVVDGLDEWASPDRARQCLERLEVFASTKKASVVASSRPFSTADLPLDRQRWRIARLAPLDSGQQRVFITRWLAPVNEDATGQAHDWAEEIARSPHLKELSDLPLFLALLLRSREQKAEFPEDLYSVLNEAVDRMIGDHRKRKVDTSQIPDQFPRTSDIRKISASAADHMHRRSLISISDDELRGTFRSTLTDAIGYPADRAHAIAQALVDALSPGVGLMIRPAPDETQFFHRSVLEFLAAERMLTLDHDALTALACTHATDRRWALAIRFLLRGLIRPLEIRSVFTALDEAGRTDPLIREATDLLAADVAVGAGAADASTRRQLLDRVNRQIEFGDRLAHRLQLLSRLVPGLSRPETRDDLAARFRIWLEASAPSTAPGALEVTAEWPADQDTLNLLWHALHTDDDKAQRTAARVIGTIFNSDEAVAQRLADLAGSTLRYDRRAAAIEALSAGWPHHTALDALITSGITHPDYAVRRACVEADLRRGTGNDHRTPLIELLTSAPRYSAWADGVMQLMFDHYPDDQTIFEAFEPDADPAQHEKFRYKYEEVPSTLVVLTGYSHRSQARGYLLYLLSPKRSDPDTTRQLIDYLPWEQLAQAYRADREVVSAVEAYLHAGNRASHRDLYYGSLIARTDQVRDQIIARLPETFGIGWSIRALLEQWPDDPAARQALDDLITSDMVPDQAVSYLPDIVDDPAKALDLLTALAPTASDQAAVIEALGNVSRRLDAPDEGLADLLTQVLTQGSRTWLSDPEASAFVHFPTQDGIHQRALERLNEPEAPVAAITYGFRNDTPMRRLLAARQPLSAPLRARLVETLGELPTADDETTALLALHRTETDPTVRILAAAAYARRVRLGGTVPEHLIDEFVQELHTTGPSHDSRRVAGFCALAELGELSRLADLQESDGQPVAIDPPIANQEIFFGFVCKHWNAVKNAFGPDYLKRLSRHSSTGIEAFEGILAVAHDYPDTHPDLVELLQQHPQLKASAAGLSFLSRTNSPAQTLRDTVLSVLQGATAGTFRSYYAQWTALHILTENFASDAQATNWFNDVLAGLRTDADPRRQALPWLSHGTAAAIARLRPDHPLVTELAQTHQRPADGPWLTFLAWTELGAAAAKSAPDLLEHARRVTRIVRLNNAPADVIHQPLTARLRQNPTLAVELKRLVPQLHGADRGTAIRLLERSGHVDDELQAYLKDIAQHTAHPDDATLDPLTARPRNIITLARDILDTTVELNGTIQR